MYGLNTQKYANNATQLKRKWFSNLEIHDKQYMHFWHVLLIILGKSKIMSGKWKSLTTCPVWQVSPENYVGALKVKCRSELGIGISVRRNLPPENLLQAWMCMSIAVQTSLILLFWSVCIFSCSSSTMDELYYYLRPLSGVWHSYVYINNYVTIFLNTKYMWQSFVLNPYSAGN